MSDYIPLEIIAQILIRLPVKLILKCKCVCKPWYSLITSPNFISMHTHFTINNNNTTHLLVRHYSTTQSEEERYTLCLDKESLDICEEIPSPFLVSNFDYVTLIGFCNGLLCFSDDRRNDNNKYTIFLWNPSIRASMILPSPSIKKHVTFAAIGFGFDSKTNDYKVVRIVYHQGVQAKTVRLPTNSVEVYELSRGVWRSINVEVDYVVDKHSSQVFLNGAVHWLGYSCNEADNMNKLSVGVVVFDFGDEVFWEIELPGCFSFVNLRNMYLVSKGKSLALMETIKPLTHFRIWEMEEYGAAESWWKCYTIDLSFLMPIERPLAFRKNGDILLGKYSGILFSCNFKTQKVFTFPINEIETYLFVDIHMESLVLLRGANRVWGQASSSNAVTDKGAPESKVEGSKRLNGAQ